MSISAVGGCSAAQTQATQYSSTTNTGTTAITASGAARDGSTIINAIASALSAIGVSSSPAAGAGASTGSSAGDTTTDPAKALGDFFHTLMDTLHSQGTGGAADNGKQQAAQGADAPHAHHSGGKGRHIESELKGPMSSLGSTGTDGTADSSTSALSSSFKNLLGSLGVDSSDSGTKLGQFLQTLSAKLESSGPSGNLVNTTA